MLAPYTIHRRGCMPRPFRPLIGLVISSLPGAGPVVAQAHVRLGPARSLLLALLVAAGCAHLPRTSSDIPLRVMTYNIRSGNGNLTGTAQAIRDAAPDLVGLQEVDVHWAERSSFVDQASSLGEQLGMQVRFARIYQLPATRADDPPREFGVAVLSKFPIVDWSNHVITRLSTQETNPLPAPLPGFLEAK